MDRVGRQPVDSGRLRPTGTARTAGTSRGPPQWEQHIHRILTEELKFRSTTHEKCLYSRTDSVTMQLQLLLCQVDDFSVSTADQQACTAIIQAIGSFLKVPPNDLGLIRKLNGVNVTQMRWYIKISCQAYLLKILENHGWLKLKASNHQPIPMLNKSADQQHLELAERPTNKSNFRSRLDTPTEPQSENSSSTRWLLQGRKFHSPRRNCLSMVPT